MDGMEMRERVEDLGRIAAMLSNLMKHDQWDLPFRRKDFLDWIEEIGVEKRDDYLHKLIYFFGELEHELYEILEVAEGRDLLNRPDGE